VLQETILALKTRRRKAKQAARKRKSPRSVRYHCDRENRQSARRA
jgi:hypothetical protein